MKSLPYLLLCMLLLCALLSSCGRSTRVLLLQDAPMEELFRIQGLSNQKLKRQLSRTGHQLSVENVPLYSEGTEWTVDMLSKVDTMDVVIISPLMEPHLESLFGMMSEHGIVLYLGTSTPELPGGDRIRGTIPVPDTSDSSFLSYLADERVSKAAIYDPALINGSADVPDALQNNIQEEYLISTEMLLSRQDLLYSLQSLIASGNDHILLILSALDIGHIIPILQALQTELAQLSIISTVVPVAGPIIGGFPFHYDHIIRHALQELRTIDREPEEDGRNIRIPIPFSAPRIRGR